MSAVNAPAPHAGHNNNFTFIRWLAAGAVLVSHSYQLTGGRMNTVIVPHVTITDLQFYAVNVFFFVSGYLVTGSLLRRGSIRDYLRARLLRIYPGLIVMLFITLGLLGLGLSRLPLSAFWSDGVTWHYLIGGGTLLNVQYHLPGVFDGENVNGSLWTLPNEFALYIALAIVGWLGGIRSKTVLWLFIALAFLTCFIVSWIPHDIYPHRVVERFATMLPRLGFCFFLGMAYSQTRRWIPLSIWGVALCWILVRVFFVEAPFESKAIDIALAYTTAWFAYVPWRFLSPLHRLPDYSYGIYIYAYPLQQSARHLWPDMSSAMNILVAGSATLLLAALSWHFVERPALKYARTVRDIPKARPDALYQESPRASDPVNPL